MSAILCELSPVIYLHRRSLTDRHRFGGADACRDGLALFDEFVRLQGRKSSLRLTVTHLLWAAVDARTQGFLGWAQELGILPRLNLRGADLRGANLRSANLRGADLRGADLRGANLGGANLRSANLRGANLRGANLDRADLGGANLYGADLYGANLYGADLRGADLRGANLYGANLYGANLYGANLYGANLGGARRWSDDAPVQGWATGQDGTLRRSA